MVIWIVKIKISEMRCIKWDIWNNISGIKYVKWDIWYKIYEITKAYKIGEMTDKKLVKKLFVQRTISDDFKDNW